MANFLRSAKALLLEGKSAITRAVEQRGAGAIGRAVEEEGVGAISRADHLFGGRIGNMRARMAPSRAPQEISNLPARKGALSVGRPQNADHLFPTGTSPGVMDLPIRKGSVPMQPQSADGLFSGRVAGAPAMRTPRSTPSAPGVSDFPIRRGAVPPSMQAGDHLFDKPELPLPLRGSAAKIPSTDHVWSQGSIPAVERGKVPMARNPKPGDVPAGFDTPSMHTNLPRSAGTTNLPRSAQGGLPISAETNLPQSRSLLDDGADTFTGELARRDPQSGALALRPKGGLAVRPKNTGALAIRNQPQATGDLAIRPRGTGGLARIPSVEGQAGEFDYFNRRMDLGAMGDLLDSVPQPPATTGATAARTAAAQSGPPPIDKMKDPSRLIDWATAPALGATIGGIKGFAEYDPSKEQDPLLKQTPFIARMKAAGESAAKGAGIGLAGVAGERALVGIGRAAMSAEQKALLPGPISLTEAFTKGFGSTAGAAGDSSMGSISKRVMDTFDENSGYVAAVRTDRGIKAEEAVSRRMSAIQASAGNNPAGAATAASTATATVPAAPAAAAAAAAPAATAAPAAAPRRYTVSAPAEGFVPGSVPYTPPTPPAATAATAAAAVAPAAPAAATQAAATNAPRVQRTAQLEQLNRQREKIRNNTLDSMMKLPDHMTPERVDSIVKSGRGLVDLGVITATAAGAAAGTPILMAKQAVHNYKKHILEPNEKTSQVSAGFGLTGPQIHNPWLSEGQATGDYLIRDTLPAQIGDGKVAKVAAASAITSVVGVAAMGGAMSATSYGGGPGHPMNALRMKDPAVSAQAQMDADASNKIRMSDPSQLGLADAEEMYYTNPSMKPVQSRSRPGQYNDTGNLTLALSALRRG
ncbi:MAG: hypothetical protein EB127_00035 [Alphaproteobacteria bacterium]|nr:hypothetical protein [Alphaproteobacteria bacterium]